MSSRAIGIESLARNLMQNMMFTRLTHLSGKMYVSFLMCDNKYSRQSGPVPLDVSGSCFMNVLIMKEI